MKSESGFSFAMASKLFYLDQLPLRPESIELMERFANGKCTHFPLTKIAHFQYNEYHVGD